MKKIVDKPSVTIKQVVTVLILSFVLLRPNVKSVDVIAPQLPVTPDIVVGEPMRQGPPQDIPVVKTVALSRGGSVPIKQLTQRDIINRHVLSIARQYNMKPELIMSIIQQESEYNPKAKNGNCLGLMQVSSYWHKDRASKLGVTDFYDAYSNILVGVDYISELMTTYKDIRLVLMLYNMNHDTAISMYKNGQISNYAKTILARAEKYEKGE